MPEIASASAEDRMSLVNTWSRCRHDVRRGVDSSHHVRSLCRGSAHRNSSAQLSGCSLQVFKGEHLKIAWRTANRCWTFPLMASMLFAAFACCFSDAHRALQWGRSLYQGEGFAQRGDLKAGKQGIFERYPRGLLRQRAFRELGEGGGRTC